MNAIVSNFEPVVNGYFVDSPHDFVLKTKYFADNTVDFIMSRIKHKIPKLHKEMLKGESTLYPKTLTDEEQESKRLENIERAARRARQAVHHAVRQIGADHMLTLTTRENITDRAKFFELWTRFIRLVRTKDLYHGQLITRKDLRHYPYCAVPEYQERGAFHMHVACVGKQDIPLLRACWYTALGGQINDTGEDVKGQIDIRYNPKRFSGESELFKTFKLVNYLTKYISKSFEASEELGIHRYSKSREIPKVITHKQFLIAAYSNGNNEFLDAMKEVISISEFIGVGNDYQLWNRGLDLFVLRGTIK
jgi:hypothetical protein